MLKVQIQREAALSHAVFGKGCPVTISSVLALNVLFFISGQHEASRRRRLALQHQELPHQGRRRCLDLLHHRRRLCPVCHPPFEGVEDGLIQMNRTKHLVRHFSTCLNKWKFNIRLIASFLLRGAMCQFLGFWGQQIWAQISNYRETSGLEPRTCEIGTWKTHKYGVGRLGISVSVSRASLVFCFVGGCYWGAVEVETFIQEQ